MERWLAETAPKDLLPPAQCPLIEQDLASIDQAAPSALLEFRIPSSTFKESHALGAAWVLAGSSLGNLSILKELRRAGHADWPCAFLGNQEMLAFWQNLRRRTERPAGIDGVEAASAAATAVFDHFLRLAQPHSNVQSELAQ
ncbi:MAG: hypothetical protein AAGK01_00605 [Pseudomonadota bacterium]